MNLRPIVPITGPVPCNGCTACCRNGDALRLLPEDDPTQYQTVPHAFMRGHLMLDHQANGDCIYLTAEGCSIHDRKPLMCREMDCRNLAKAITWTQMRKGAVRIPMAVWRRGRELLAEGSAL
jgi:hypothetical protein